MPAPDRGLTVNQAAISAPMLAPAEGSGNLRLFLLAYAATLVIGGLALFAFFQLRSGGSSESLSPVSGPGIVAAMPAGGPDLPAGAQP